MPWHHKREETIEELDGSHETIRIAGQSGVPGRTRIRSVFRRTKVQPKAPEFHPFASNVRTRVGAAINDAEAMEESDKWSATMIVLAAGVLFAICFARFPDTAFRVLLLGQMLLCTFPTFLDNWILLIPILLPMSVQSRLEVILGLGMLSWLGRLDWAFAWYCVLARFTNGQCTNQQCPDPSVIA